MIVYKWNQSSEKGRKLMVLSTVSVPGIPCQGHYLRYVN